MRNVIGNPARGDDFFNRKSEIKKLGRRIEAGGHLQLTAPRRVGKTSILMYFIDNPVQGYHFVYADTEGVNSSNDYFKKLCQEVFKCKGIKTSQKIAKQFTDGRNKLLGKIKSVKLFEAELEFSDASETDYLEEFTNFVKGIDLEGEKIILLNDEFPYTIENIVNANDGDTALAIDFLKVNRALRIDPEIAGKLQIVYTGSIGLNALVERMGKTELINDVDSIGVNALKVEEAKELLHLVLSEYDYTMKADVVEYLLNRIEWLIPFHIQLAVKEIMDIADSDDEITTVIVDAAFNKIVEYRNNNYFDHYYTRLRKHFKKDEFKFAEDLLCQIAANGTMHSNEMYNMAVGYKVESQYKSIIGTLMYDGYINNNEQVDTYRFNSPIIKIWWNKYVCN